MIRIDTSDIEHKLDLLLQRVNSISEEIDQLKPEREEVEAYSISKAAQKLSCSRGKVRNLFVNGELDGFQERKGGKIFIYPESVYHYLRGKAC